jgi:hypothetical protein
MLKQSDGLRFDELVDHVTEDGPDGVETFVGVAYVG